MYILFDIGGTKTRVAYSSDGETCSEPIVIKTPEDFEEGMDEIARVAKEVSGGQPIKIAAGGVAGPMDRERTCLVNAPNLAGWNDKPLREELSSAIGAATFIENDTAIVGLGEATRGAGKGSEIVVYITVSTGVGGVRIVNGKIDKSRFGFEIGHQLIDFDNTACMDCIECSICDGVVDLESMVSGSATKRRRGVEPYEITQDDPLWEELSEWLSVGLVNTIVHWSPDVVVLGGSMMVGEPRIPLDSVSKNLKSKLKIFKEHPELRLADLKDFGGLYGALEFAKQQEK